MLQVAIIKHVLCETAKRLEHELQQVQRAANRQCGCVLVAYLSYLVNEDLRRMHLDIDMYIEKKLLENLLRTYL